MTGVELIRKHDPHEGDRAAYGVDDMANLHRGFRHLSSLRFVAQVRHGSPPGDGCDPGRCRAQRRTVGHVRRTGTAHRVDPVGGAVRYADAPVHAKNSSRSPNASGGMHAGTTHRAAPGGTRTFVVSSGFGRGGRSGSRSGNRPRNGSARPVRPSRCRPRTASPECLNVISFPSDSFRPAVRRGQTPRGGEVV